MRKIVNTTIALGACFLAANSTPAFADTPQAIIELHDSDRGSVLIEQFFQDAWNGTANAHFQSFGCTSGINLYDSYYSNGKRDERPIEVNQIMILGNPSPLGQPSYLVSGSRSVWYENHSEYIRIPCTYLVSFNGNRVRSVREASELSYLFQSSD